MFDERLRGPWSWHGPLVYAPPRPATRPAPVGERGGALLVLHDSWRFEVIGPSPVEPADLGRWEGEGGAPADGCAS